MLSTRDNVKNIPTSLLVEIQMNQYRSKDGQRDYCQESIDEELWERQRKIDDNHNIELEKFRYEGSSI